MTQYFVSPLHENQKQRWEKMYGRSHLPIKYPTPHIACTQRWGDVPVYYLDVMAVPDALLNRLATYESKRMGIHYQEARAAVRREWLIRAEGCLVEREAPTSASIWQPSFSFLQKVPYRVSPVM